MKSRVDPEAGIGTVAKLAGTSVMMLDQHYRRFRKTDVQDNLAAISLV